MTVVAMSAGPAGAGGKGGQLGRIPPEVWAALLDDAKARPVHERAYRRGPGQRHFWLGALSSSG